MNRRSAIRNLAVIAGGILILPSCKEDRKKGKASIKLSQLDLDINQENLLADIGETMLPATDTPGSRELQLHLFVMKMVDDCYEKEDQEQFVRGLTALEKAADKKYGKSFTKLEPTEKRAFLLSIENNKEEDPDISAFYRTMKYRTIQGYKNSKYVMTNLLKYDLIPGRYNGYFPVKA